MKCWLRELPKEADPEVPPEEADREVAAEGTNEAKLPQGPIQPNCWIGSA